MFYDALSVHEECNNYFLLYFQLQCVLRLINTYFDNKPEGVEYQYGAEVMSNCYNKFSSSFKCNARLTLSGDASNYISNCPKKAQRQINDNVSMVLKKLLRGLKIYNKHSVTLS